MKRLIVIEEDTDAREMITFTFENNGYEVITCDKNVSVEAISKLKPHIMVIGYQLAGTPGNNICLKLKENTITQNIPLILYSANLNVSQISINSVADGFIAKPLELEDFIYLVHRIALS